jgi:hypothetical protein
MGEERGCGVVHRNIEAGVWGMGRVGAVSFRGGGMLDRSRS